MSDYMYIFIYFIFIYTTYYDNVGLHAYNINNGTLTSY